MALREAGTITWAEFDRRKAALLVKPERPEPRRTASSFPVAWVVLALVVVGVAVVLVIATR